MMTEANTSARPTFPAGHFTYWLIGRVSIQLARRTLELSGGVRAGCGATMRGHSFTLIRRAWRVVISVIDIMIIDHLPRSENLWQLSRLVSLTSSHISFVFCSLTDFCYGFLVSVVHDKLLPSSLVNLGGRVWQYYDCQTTSLSSQRKRCSMTTTPPPNANLSHPLRCVSK